MDLKTAEALVKEFKALDVESMDVAQYNAMADSILERVREGQEESKMVRVWTVNYNVSVTYSDHEAAQDHAGYVSDSLYLDFTDEDGYVSVTVDDVEITQKEVPASSIGESDEEDEDEDDDDEDNGAK